MDKSVLYNKLKQTIEQEAIHVLKSRSKLIGEYLENGNTINFAVLGEFKSGKSSFLNSFIGKDILPTGVIPITSVITRISKGSRNKAIVYFSDGYKKEILVSNIEHYINESKNPNNYKKVDYVEIKLEGLDFLNGIPLIDTPGLGSFLKHNTKTTKQWFGRIGLAIIAISPERPLGENEVNLIRAIIDETPEIAILLTKTDLYDEQEISNIETYILSSLKSEFTKEFRIFRYSVKKKTNDYNKLIVEHLIDPINNEFDLKKENILNHKLHSLAQQCIGYLDLARISSVHTEEEREKLKSEIFNRMINYNFIAKEMALVLSDTLNGIRDKVLGILLPEQDMVQKNLTTRFKVDYNSWNGNLYKRTRFFEQWMKVELSKVMAEIADKHKKEFENIVDNAVDHFVFFTSSFRNGLKGRLKKVLDIDMPIEIHDLKYPTFNKPNIFVRWTFDSHIDLLWFLFPMGIFGKIFGRYFEKQIHYETKINIYRLTSEINNRISHSIRHIKKQSEKYIADELSTIENILTNPTTKSSYYDNLIIEINKLITKAGLNGNKL